MSFQFFGFSCAVYSDQKSIISQVTRAGYQAVISSPFYLNYISYGIDWLKYYKVDITNFSGSIEQKRLIKGGEVS